VFSETTVVSDIPTAAYIHIPFCRRRCFYCDFPISVVGDRRDGSNFNTIAHYINVLCQEIQLTTATNQPLQTVFFGGGTPSLLTVEQVAQVLDALGQQFGISATAEISMEIDPGTFDLAKVQGYRAAGVNRVSLGVQAFQPELLRVCGRSHQVEDVYAAIYQIRQAGFDNISLDLISGLPGQTLQDWQASLEQAIALQPTHLSCYDLTVEPGTPFSRQYKPGSKPLPSDEMTAEMYRTAQRTLTVAEFEHYEISNYAKPGYQCRHNRVYWENHPFYGFGMGATSYVGGDRVSRPRKTREYFEWVGEGRVGGVGGEREVGGGGEDGGDGSQPISDRLLDTLMLGLRLADGLSLNNLEETFGRDILERIWVCLQTYYQKGWVEVLPDRGDRFNGILLPDCGRIRLSDPEGFLVSNIILISLFEEFDSTS
jgi:oxygen-independent coproporphyrinogen-3 oxidase